jgi:hypothetical protein
MEQYRNVTICTDIMFVNSIPFIMTVSRDLKFGTAEALTNRSTKCVMAGIKNVCRVYAYRGFRITTAHGDREYEPMMGDFWDLKIRLNTTAKGEHVPKIERYIRTTKDRCRCIYNTVPFDRIPSRMTVESMEAFFGLTCFPAMMVFQTRLVRAA